MMARSSMNQDQAPLSLSSVEWPAMKLLVAAKEEAAVAKRMARNGLMFIDKG